jgi:hypothetical protein
VLAHRMSALNADRFVASASGGGGELLGLLMLEAVAVGLDGDDPSKGGKAAGLRAQFFPYRPIVSFRVRVWCCALRLNSTWRSPLPTGRLRCGPGQCCIHYLDTNGKVIQSAEDSAKLKAELERLRKVPDVRAAGQRAGHPEPSRRVRDSRCARRRGGRANEVLAPPDR